MASRVYRNKKIARHIQQELNCCITGAPYPDPHHIIGSGYSAMGSKAPDWTQMALSHHLHQELHQHGWKAFEAKYGRTQKSMVAETLAKLHADQIIDLYQLEVDGWVFEEMEKLYCE